MNTINELLDVTKQIGDISESNGHFLEGIIRRVNETGRDIEDLKISEFIALMEQHREFYNNALAGNIANDSVVTDAPKKISLDEMLARQDLDRGFTPLPLETDLLLKRVNDGGYSGEYLASAFISSYRTDEPFNLPLGKILKLDAEAQRLFFEILCVRMIPGWSDQELYEIEQQIKTIVAGGVK